MIYNKYIALIAHDGLKSEMVNFVRRHKNIFEKIPLIATASTGKIIFDETKLMVERLVPSGLQGGDQVIGSLITSGEITAVLFMRDPLSRVPHQEDVHALLRLCDLYKVPLATNISTAEILINYLRENYFQKIITLKNKVAN
jgi:methylglyoxal synthase